MTPSQKRTAILDALGTVPSGLWLSGLIARTKLTGDEIEDVLRALERAGLVKGIGTRPVLWRRA